MLVKTHIPTPWILTPNQPVEVSIRKKGAPTHTAIMPAWKVQYYIDLQEKAGYRITDIRKPTAVLNVLD